MTLAATTKERVKARLIKTANDDDTLIDELIDSVSQEMEAWIDSPFLSGSQLETYNVSLHQRIFMLRSTPASAITAIKHTTAADRDFTQVIAIDAQHYFLGPEGKLVMGLELFPGDDVIEVAYTGGLGATTAALITAFPVIAQAADLQVVEEWKRKNSAGQTGKKAGSRGSISFNKHGLLPRVMQMITPFRRWAY